MTRRRRRKANESSEVWECRLCNEQMYGGPRCCNHNPTPDEREANPQAYRKERYAVSYRSLKPDAT